MKYLKLLTVAGCAFLLSMCTEKQLTNAFVAEKKYNPAWVQTTYLCISYNGGKSFVMMPQNTYRPETYNLVLRGLNKDGVEDQSIIAVSRDDYESAVVGMVWPKRVKEDMKKEEEP